MSVQVIRTISEMQREAGRIRSAGETLGVVPTMGALHEGHGSLIRRARALCGKVIVTVFVNPTQFGVGEDFTRYPRDLDRDVELASAAGADIVFAPEASDMYPADYATSVNVEGLTSVLEGRSRPTHFRGVTTVVAKLLNITKPDIAVFGQKDAQQVVVVRQMMRDLNFDVRLEVVPIVREADGLALSSRNRYLTPEQRAQATVLHAALQLAVQQIRNGEKESAALLRAMTGLIASRPAAAIDYISIADESTLIETPRLLPGKPVLISLAVRFGTTRLIDNIVVAAEGAVGHPIP